MTEPTSTHAIWHLVYRRCEALDAVGPFEVFGTANHVVARQPSQQQPNRVRYRQLLVSLDGTTIETDSGLGLATTPLDELDVTKPPDTLMIAGGRGVDGATENPELVAWVADVGSRTTRLATVCTGTFLAAKAGLLDGHTVTTHWARRDRLAQEYPEIDVDVDAIYCRSGRVWSSAGVTAGMDLALAMVEADHDARVAQIVARWLVIHLRRPGGQSQYAAPVWFPTSTADPVRRAQELVTADPTADLTVERLADHVGVSGRHLSRLFAAELDCTPARFVEQVRLATARAELEQTAVSLDEIARRAGFGTAETLRRVFHRHLGIAPDTYRRRFALTAS